MAAVTTRRSACRLICVSVLAACSRPAAAADAQQVHSGDAFLVKAASRGCLRRRDCRTRISDLTTRAGCYTVEEFAFLDISKVVCPEQQAAERLHTLVIPDDTVAFVARDGVVRIDPPIFEDDGARSSRSRGNLRGSGNDTALPPGSWALDRVNQLEGMDGINTTCASGGEGVEIIILDTGCRTTHEQIAGRASVEASLAMDTNGQDGNGHGTHCAGLAAGTTTGTAPLASVTCMQVLSAKGQGDFSDVIAALDVVAAKRNNTPSKPMVVSMSLGGEANDAMDDAITTIVGMGIPVVVAAGNADSDACYDSPARTPSAITVGATTMNDTKAFFSNYGECLDLYAPGLKLFSSWGSTDNSYKTISGTSMSTPLVAGAIACVLSSSGKACNTLARYTHAIQGDVNITSEGGFAQKLLYSPPGISAYACDLPPARGM